MPIKPPAPRYARHPFEVCSMASFIFSCLSLALFGPSGSAAADYSIEYQIMLAGAVLFGSTLVLFGAYRRDVILGAFTELAGLLVCSGFIAAWVLGVTSRTDNWSSGLAACAFVSILVACVWRSKQIISWIIWVYKSHPPEFWKNRAQNEAARESELNDTYPPLESTHHNLGFSADENEQNVVSNPLIPNSDED